MSQELLEISPAEITADILNRLCLPVAASGAVVGPTNDAQQQSGVISCMASGLPVVELYVPMQSMRAQLRCLAGTLDEAEKISQRTMGFLQVRNRVVAYQASIGQRFLVHWVKVIAGPSMHYDSNETWETLLFAELMVHTTPL